MHVLLDVQAKSLRLKELVLQPALLQEMFSANARKSNTERLDFARDAANGPKLVTRRSTSLANGLERLFSRESRLLATGEENPRPPNNVSAVHGFKFVLVNPLPKRTRSAHGLDLFSIPSGFKTVNGNHTERMERDNTAASKQPCAMATSVLKADKTVLTRDQFTK